MEKQLNIREEKLMKRCFIFQQ